MGSSGLFQRATLVIVPFSAFGNPETSAVSLICLGGRAPGLRCFFPCWRKGNEGRCGEESLSFFNI